MHLFAGPGQARALARSVDWGATPLGPVAGWPQSLRTAVAMCLGQPFPNAVLWGPDLVCFPNDASIALLGRTWPGAMGRPVRDVMGEAWLDVAPRIEQVLATGEPCAAPDVAIPLDRGDLRDAFFTLSLSPLDDEAGQAAGILAAGIDMTPQMRTEAALRASESRYRALLDSMDEAYAVVEVIADAGGRWSDFRFLEVNPRFMEHTGMPYPVGRTATELLGTPNPRWAELYGRAVDTGESMRFEEEELTLGRAFDLNVFRLGDREHRRVGVLFTDVTSRKHADAAVRSAASRDAYRVALTDALRAAGNPIDAQEAATRVLGDYLGAGRVMYGEADAGSTETFTNHREYRRDEAMPSSLGQRRWDDFGAPLAAELRAGRTLVVDDVRTHPRHRGADLAAYDAVGIRSYVVVPLVRDGHVAAYLAVNHNAPHTWTADELALTEETAERTWAAVARARAEVRLRASEERYRILVENVHDYAIFMLDAEGTVVEWTAGAEHVLGFTADEALGRHVSTFYGAEGIAAGEPERELAEAASRGRAEREGWRMRRNGTRFWANEIASAVLDGAGRLVGYARICRDLTGRRLAEETAERVRAEGTREEMRRGLSAAEEAERRRLSREIHDQLGQHLTAFALGLGEARRLLDAGQSPRDGLARLEELARLTSRNARYLALELRPSELDDVGIASALHTYVEEWSKRYGVAADVEVIGAAASAALPPEVATAVYRIVQEALTNVAKHAHAKQVTVLLDNVNGETRLIVEDDGRGFHPEAEAARIRAERRLGLVGMRERAALVGGTLELESGPDGTGTTVYVRVPMQED